MDKAVVVPIKIPSNLITPYYTQSILVNIMAQFNLSGFFLINLSSF